MKIKAALWAIAIVVAGGLLTHWIVNRKKGP